MRDEPTGWSVLAAIASEWAKMLAWIATVAVGLACAVAPFVIIYVVVHFVVKYW